MSLCVVETSFKSYFNFSIEKTLSKGTATLLLVKSNQDKKRYVIKSFSEDEPSVYSFLKEKQIHSSLVHPNIIQYIPNDSFLLNNPPYNMISMEYAPFGDFFNFALAYKPIDEKLIRTYFHQLIEGLSYLHTSNIAHLDLKLENLLLGKDFLLKIADFGLAQKSHDKLNPTISKGGTANYRAPEILTGTCQDYFAADIYSAGVCLYILIAGAFPFLEEVNNEGNLTLFRYDLFLLENEKFWSENENLVGTHKQGNNHFSQDFKELINKMWAKSPSERMTLSEIKRSRWYNEPIYSNEDLKNNMKKLLRGE